MPDDVESFVAGFCLLFCIRDEVHDVCSLNWTLLSVGEEAG